MLFRTVCTDDMLEVKSYVIRDRTPPYMLVKEASSEVQGQINLKNYTSVFNV